MTTKTVELTDAELDILQTSLLKDAKTLRDNAATAQSMVDLMNIERGAALREALQAKLSHIAEANL